MSPLLLKELIIIFLFDRNFELILKQIIRAAYVFYVRLYDSSARKSPSYFFYVASPLAPHTHHEHRSKNAQLMLICLSRRNIWNLNDRKGCERSTLDVFFCIYINETVLLLITDKSRQSIRDSLMSRTERGVKT